MTVFSKAKILGLTGLDKVGLFLIGRASQRVRELVTGDQAEVAQVQPLKDAVSSLPDMIRGDQTQLQLEIKKVLANNEYLRLQYQQGPDLKVSSQDQNYQAAA